MERNPIAVVRLVKKTGCRLTRILSIIASCLVMPPFIPLKRLIKKWIESATARVMIIVGAEEEGGVSAIPNQPANPIPVATEKNRTITVPIVAVTDRRSRKVINIMMRYMIGIKVPISCMEDSKKELLNMTIPVKWTSTG